MWNDILLVDRDANVAEVVADVLDEDGIRTLWMPDVGQALSVLRRVTPPRLALIDHRLADNGSLKLMSAATEEGVPFCLLTTDPALAALMGVHGVPVLQKPFGVCELHQAIDAALRWHRGLAVKPTKPQAFEGRRLAVAHVGHAA